MIWGDENGTGTDLNQNAFIRLMISSFLSFFLCMLISHVNKTGDTLKYVEFVGFDFHKH